MPSSTLRGESRVVRDLTQCALFLPTFAPFALQLEREQHNCNKRLLSTGFGKHIEPVSSISDPSLSNPRLTRNPSSSAARSVSMIVAAVVSVLAIAAITIGVFFFVRRRRRLRRDRQGVLLDMTAIDEDDEPSTTFAGGSPHGPPPGNLVPTPFLYSQSSTGHQEAALMETRGQHHPAAPIRPNSDLFSPPPTETDSFARSLSTVSAPSVEHTGLYAGVGFSVDGVVEQTRRSKSGQVVSTPPTSVGGERMRVRGREQDAGPIAHPNEDEDKDDEEPLPPDYHQVGLRARSEEETVRSTDANRPLQAIQPFDRR